VTSSRAVDAWSNALKILSGRDKSTLDPHSDRATRQGGRSWKSVPFYVVGPRTERQLLDLRSESSWCDWLPAPELVLGAKESGTGEALAKFICADYPTRSSSHLPLLYLIGDKNAGGVERGLKESGIGVHMTQVYATSASGTFSGDFEKGVKEGEGKGEPDK
jgi:uroporphyrinogen-III synthase